MRKIINRRGFSQRGDTLVEVMVSIAVLGLIVVGSMAIMNKSSGDMLNAVERTEVRTSINSQTEMLNFLRNEFMNASQGAVGANPTLAQLWTDMKLLAQDSSVDVSGPCRDFPNGSRTPGSTRPGSFYLTLDAATGVKLSEYTKASGASEGTNFDGRAIVGNGLWIDAVKSPSGGVEYTDFYVKACWAPVGGGIVSQSSTIVRLYDK